MFTKTKTKQRSMRFWLILGVIIVVALLTQMSAFVPAYGQTGDTITVDFALNGGAPTYRASGFIYGLSTDASTPAPGLSAQVHRKLTARIAAGSTGSMLSAGISLKLIMPSPRQWGQPLL